jgi:HK97 family phage portal protein
MTALKTAARNAFSIIKGATPPDFSGVTGQINHRTGPATLSGQKIDEASSLRVAAIWIAVSVLADEQASLVMRIVRKDDQQRTPQQPESLRALWSDEPNPDQTHFGIEATETMSMALWGASYTMLGWNRAGDLDVRWPVDPARVSLERLDGGGLRLKATGQGELNNRPGERPEFAYCPLYTLPGSIEPVSPVRMAAELAGLSLAYQETAARLMGRGLNPSAVVMAGEPVDEEQAKAIAGRIEEGHGGAGRAGGTIVLGGHNLKLERLTMSMADAEFVAQHDLVFKMLLSMWRIPPTVAGMVDKPSTWGTGVAEFSRGLERFTLRPIVQRRQSAHHKYITTWVDPALQVKYLFDSLLSASPKDRAEIQKTRMMMGATSVERVLAQEDEPPFGEDETVYSQLALATDEDRRLQRLKSQAEAYGALIRAGVEPDAAATETGFDPSLLTHTGLAPVTVQPEGGEG